MPKGFKTVILSLIIIGLHLDGSSLLAQSELADLNESINTFSTYTITTKRAFEFESKIIAFSENNIIYENSEGVFSLRISNISKIELTKNGHSTAELFHLNNTNGSESEIKLLGYKKYDWKFKTLEGKEISVRKNRVQKLEVIGKSRENPSEIKNTNQVKIKATNPISTKSQITTRKNNYIAEIIAMRHNEVIVKDKTGLHTLQLNDILSLHPSVDSLDQYDSSEKYFQVEKINGEKLEGYILNYEGFDWQFITLYGVELTIRKNKIRSIELLENGEFVHRKIVKSIPALKPTPTSSFIAPTAFLMKKGQSEYRNVSIIANTFDTGVSDHLNLGVGATSVLLASLLSARVKIGTSIGKWYHFSAGFQGGILIALDFGGSSDDDDPIPGFYNYHGTVTVGTTNHHVSASLGGIYFDTKEAEPTLTLSGAFRTGSKFGLLFELNILNNDYFDIDNMLNLGGSVYLDSGKFDFGVALVVKEGSYHPLPLLAYSYYF